MNHTRSRPRATVLPVSVLITMAGLCAVSCSNKESGAADTAQAADTAADTGTPVPLDSQDGPPDGGSPPTDAPGGDAASDATEADGAPRDTGNPDAAGHDTIELEDTSTRPDGGTKPDTIEQQDVGADAKACDYVCALDCVCAKDEQGCDLPQCEQTPECNALSAEAQNALSVAAAGCEEPTACQFFEYPICGSIGCFQGAIMTGANTTALEAASEAAMQAGCEPFHCGCAPPLGTPVCLQGNCKLCPPNCGSLCPDLRQAVGAFAQASAQGCEKDEDCAVVKVPVCALENAIQCHALAYRTYPTEALALLSASIEQLNCLYDECDCQFEKAACFNGNCIPVDKDPEPNCGGPTPVFPTFHKSCEADSDCALVFHQINCCGTLAAWGISKSEAPAFKLAEQTCQSQYPDCKCAQAATEAELGGSSFDPADFGVTCQAGTCKSLLLPSP